MTTSSNSTKLKISFKFFLFKLAFIAIGRVIKYKTLQICSGTS